MVVFFIIAIFLVIVFSAVLGSKQALQRRNAMAKVAQLNSWQFVHDRDRQHDDRFRQFRNFRRGKGRYAYNSMFGRVNVGEKECRLKTGDFHYETESDDSTHHHHFSYLLIEVPFPNSPDLSIRLEGMMDKLGGFFGFDDIDFESAEFSNRFHVKSGDKRFAYDVIHPQMMEFLLATPGPMLQISGGHCCVTTRGRWDPEEFKHYVEWTKMFFERWPNHVTADLESRIE